MGALLARSITYAVHELFVGTERVQHGRFRASHPHRLRRSARRPGRLLQSHERQHRAPAARAAREAAAGRRAAHRARDPEVAAAGRAAGVARADDRGPVRAGARSGRRLLRFLRSGPAPAGRHGGGRVGQRHVGGALHGRAQGPDAVAQPRGSESPRRLLIEANRLLADAPRQPQLHHDDLRRHRPRRAHADVRARRPHAARSSCPAARAR